MNEYVFEKLPKPELGKVCKLISAKILLYSLVQFVINYKTKVERFNSSIYHNTDHF